MRSIRVYVYDHILARGVPPTSREIGDRFGVTPAEALQALGAMKIGKAILVHPETRRDDEFLRRLEDARRESGRAGERGSHREFWELP